MKNRNSAIHKPGKLALTFILPGNNRSGGVRVTVQMANELLARGHEVRIVLPKTLSLRHEHIKKSVKKAVSALWGRKNTGWMHLFQGKTQRFRKITELSFSKKEIVIAVGTFTIQHLLSLPGYVLPLRYNHGFPVHMSESQQKLWSLRIPTIAVSQTLTDMIKNLSGDPVVGVVPNGVPSEHYFKENFTRDGIGFLFNSHPNKGMELMELVIARVRNRFPALKVYAFGTERKPSFLRKNEYWRSPSVDKARELYNRSIIWLLTSHTEGLPGSALESMSCGTPVISTDNDGSREIVRHMKNGILVPRGKADTFIPAIQHLLSDPDLWRNISNGAMSTAAGFTWQRAVDKMESVLWSLQKNVKGDEQIVEESIS